MDDGKVTREMTLEGVAKQITELAGQIDARFEQIDARFGAIESRMTALDTKVENASREWMSS